MLEKTISLKKDVMSDSIKFFLGQYIEILRRYIVGDYELEKMCREIYFKHKKALDLIFEYKPDLYSDISQSIIEELDKSPTIVKDVSTKIHVRFTTERLDKLVPKEGQGWTSTKRILLFEFQNRNNKLVLKAIIGPGPDDIRNNLYDIASKHPEIYKGRLNSLTGSYTQIYVKEIVPRGFDEKEFEEIQGKIKKSIEQFLSGDLLEIERVIEEAYATESDNVQEEVI
jgi:hypothetical protein